MEDTMTPGHRLWKKSFLTGDALCAAWWPCLPFTWNNSISLALNLCILTWTTPHGLNVISATPHSTYNVVPGSHWPLSGTSASSALFSAAENFRSTCRPMLLDYPSPCPPSSIILASLETPSENTCSRFTSVLLVLKMAQKRNTGQKTKEATQILCQEDTDHGKIKRHGSLWRLGAQKQEDRALHSRGYD